MNIDDEILQDFLIEAGELFELLGEQIVELEQQPQDAELLNAIFRAFHTIKGGAGFLKITAMVEVCHRAEDVFDLLRRGELIADAVLIDVILQVIDVVGDMFEQVREGEELEHASPELLRQLEALMKPEPKESAVAPATAETDTATVASEVVDETGKDSSNQVSSSIDDEFDAMLQAAQNDSAEASENSDDGLITDDEFEDLLDQIHGAGKHSSVIETEATGGESDLITDEEFESLLDEIHGEGKHSAAKSEKDASSTGEADTDDGLITDEEFESMLDQIHGEGKHGAVSTATGAADKPVTAVVEPKSPVGDVASEPEADSPPAAVEEKPAVSAVTKSGTSKKSDKSRTGAKASSAESSVRVDTSRLDDIMNLVGELVLVRNRLTMLKQIVQEGSVVDAISNLEIVTSDLQASVMKTRMQPIKKVFNRFPRVIRDLARSLNKDINLVLVGEDTDLDKNLVEALADPMIHLVRNSVDHGIESPEDRFKNGKPRQGTVTLSAVQEGDQILLTISDDGKGMDHELLRSIAVSKGLMSEDEAARLTEVEAYNLIFAPGFSTKTEISDVSGRGVGMDVVKTRIAELNGTVEIDSTPGQGTVITIRLPLTLAILPTLMVNLADYQFALPLTNVNEAFNMDPEEINIVDGQEVLLVRDKPLPLYYLHSWLVNDRVFEGPQASHKVIVVQMGSQKFCLVVDHLLGQEEVVIKPLGTMLTDTPGFAGATITGDGSIALVLDMPSLVKRYAVAC